MVDPGLVVAQPYDHVDRVCLSSVSTFSAQLPLPDLLIRHLPLVWADAFLLARPFVLSQGWELPCAASCCLPSPSSSAHDSNNADKVLSAVQDSGCSKRLEIESTRSAQLTPTRGNHKK
jgi:hypothetical protein